MPVFLLDKASNLFCAHGGIVLPTGENPRVLINGQPIVLQNSPWMVAGCSFQMAGNASPCVTAIWVTAASRITAGGVPVLLSDSNAVCLPNGTPLIIAGTQARVTGI